MTVQADMFLNKSKKASQDLAEKHGIIYRLIRIDDKPFISYPDKSSDDRSSLKDRICVEIDNGKVTKAEYL